MNAIELSKRVAVEELISTALCELSPLYTTSDTVIVVYDDGLYECIPAAHLSDISYRGSRNVVQRGCDIAAIDQDAAIDIVGQLHFDYDDWIQEPDNRALLDDLVEWAITEWDWTPESEQYNF